MSIESPGGLPRVSSLLSPRAAKALDNLDSPNKIDFNLLNEEIVLLRESACDSQDSELLCQIDNLSQILAKHNKASPIKSFRYNHTDKGPFCVIIESICQNIGNLNPMNIGKLLHQTQYSNNLDIKNICRKGLKRTGVYVSTAEQANWFVDNHSLSSDSYNVYIPARMVTSMGIVRDIGSDITEDDILQYGAGMSPNTPVLRVRRFKRTIRVNDSTSQVPSGTCLITFQGTTLPKYFELFNIRTEVSLYIPPVIQCRKCLRYGHIQTHCRGNFRCVTCGESHESVPNCSETPNCVFCKGPHPSNDRTCSEYLRQVRIRELMAMHNLSLFEANAATRQKSAPLPSEFPSTSSNSFQHTSSPSHSSQPRKTSYASRTIIKSTPQKRKEKTIGFDRAAHAQALYTYSPSNTYCVVSADSPPVLPPQKKIITDSLLKAPLPPSPNDEDYPIANIILTNDDNSQILRTLDWSMEDSPPGSCS